MKNSSSWIRQEDVNEAADRLLTKTPDADANPDTITAYQVAKDLDCSPNTSIYRKFEIWKTSKLAERKACSIDLPAELTEGLALVFDRLKTQAMAELTTILRTVATSIDETANLKVAEAHRARHEAMAKVSELVDSWEKTEIERDQLAADLEACTSELAARTDEVNVLRGRLAQALEDRGKPPSDMRAPSTNGTSGGGLNVPIDP